MIDASITPLSLSEWSQPTGNHKMALACILNPEDLPGVGNVGLADAWGDNALAIVTPEVLEAMIGQLTELRGILLLQIAAQT